MLYHMFGYAVVYIGRDFQVILTRSDNDQPEVYKTRELAENAADAIAFSKPLKNGKLEVVCVDMSYTN